MRYTLLIKDPPPTSSTNFSHFFLGKKNYTYIYIFFFYVKRNKYFDI